MMEVVMVVEVTIEMDVSYIATAMVMEVSHCYVPPFTYGTFAYSHLRHQFQRVR